MVADGAVPLLSVGDIWLADIKFQPMMPMDPASSTLPLGIRPMRAKRSSRLSNSYWVTATTRCILHNDVETTVGLEVPGLVVGVDSRDMLPPSEVVQGPGRLKVDPWKPSFWALPESRRFTRVVEMILVGPGQEDQPPIELDYGSFELSSIHTMSAIEDVSSRYTYLLDLLLL
jgi:hypothetical protein